MQPNKIDFLDVAQRTSNKMRNACNRSLSGYLFIAGSQKVED